ncbi:hypothetical protein DESC_190011 [Desulfosarcina cetonica]|nr:hypothetical protein DESC_190011 [Desulfosarcina cetonica]
MSGREIALATDHFFRFNKIRTNYP